MPNTLVNTPQSFTAIIGSGESLIVTSTGNLAVNTGNAVQLTGSVTALINGDVISGNNVAIIANTIVTTGQISVGPSGYVASPIDAINLSVSSSINIENAGYISGFDAVDLNQTDGSFTANIVNTGTMSGQDSAIELNFGNGSGDIFNTGTMIGQENGISIDSGGATARTFIHNEGLIQGQLGAVTVAGSHNVTVANTGDLVGFVFFGGGDDTYMGRFGHISDGVLGGGGNDVLRGGAEANFLDGGADNDRLQGYGGDDTLIGDSGFDTLFGNAGDDSLDGGGRTDRLVGGKGDDTMTGGGGGDVFVIRRVGNGDDEVTDFQNNADVVDISALGVQNFNALKNTFGALSQDTDAVVIDLAAAGGSGSIRLVGVTVADMDASDFIF